MFYESTHPSKLATRRIQPTIRSAHQAEVGWLHRARLFFFLLRQRASTVTLSEDTYPACCTQRQRDATATLLTPSPQASNHPAPMGPCMDVQGTQPLRRNKRVARAQGRLYRMHLAPERATQHQHTKTPRATPATQGWAPHKKLQHRLTIPTEGHPAHSSISPLFVQPNLALVGIGLGTPGFTASEHAHADILLHDVFLAHDRIFL